MAGMPEQSKLPEWAKLLKKLMQELDDEQRAEVQEDEKNDGKR